MWGMSSTQGYPYQGNYGGMKIFRYFGWPTAGGSDGTQFEQRDSFLRNFLQRGCTPFGTSCGGASLSGSTPGRYVFAAHFYRMVVEKTLPRSDGTSTAGASAGFRQYCTPYTITCQQSEGFSPWGDPHPVNLTSSTSWMNGGMRNWGDAINEMEHSTYWGIFDYYHLSGDEWVKEQLLQGFKDRYENPWVQFNNPQANVTGGNNAAGHGHINAIRAIGHHISGMAREADFLCSISDLDCDTKANLTSGSPSIPGAAVGSTTPLERALNILSTAVVIPFISGGYPQGFAEASAGSLNCRQNAGTGVQNCSQGISPTRGFPRAGGSGENCTIPWNNSNPESVGQTIVDTNGNLEQVTTGGTTGSGSHPVWDTATGGTTSDGTVVWTNQGPATPPCNANNFRAADSFQEGIEAEGIYDVWQELRKIMGPDWHINVGTASGGSPILDGATSLSNALVSEKNLMDAMGLIGLQMNDGNCVSGGNYTNSGCVYTQSSDYLNAQTSPAPAPGPGCVSTGDCLRTTSAGASTCTLGCSGLTEWLGIAGAALTTNSIFNPNGTPWQFFFNSQLTGGQVVQELGSHMMQQAMSFVLANGSTSSSTSFSLASSIHALTSVPITITGCTGTGCTFGTNLCTSGSSAGTCTITWSTPTGICTVGINCPPNNAPNGQQYRLKYWYCTAGVLTILGNDCPTGGKTIRADLGFREDILTAGTVATDGFGTQVGSSTYDPAHNWNLLASIDVPDCGNGTPTSACNFAAVTGTSYTFNMQPNSTYNFYLGAYQTAGCSGVSLTPSSYDFNSSVLGVPSSDSPQTFVLNNCTAAAITSVTPSVSGTNSADFPFALPGAGGCGSTLAAGASCDITDTFTPSIVGAETASLNVSYGGSSFSGTTINAVSCNNTSANPDIQNALNSISGSGAFKIVIPAGTCSFTQALSYSVSNPVTVVGATTCTAGCASGSAGVGLAFNDQTNITMTAQWTLSGCTATNFCDVSGITFIDGMDVANGEFQMGGVFPQVGIHYHHVHWINTTRTGQGTETKIYSGYGEADHILQTSTTTAGTPLAFSIYGDGPSLGYANWAAASPWGTNQSFIIEDSQVNVAHSGDEGFMDDYEGCRVVLRYSIINGEIIGGFHGTDSSVNRGCLTLEVYNNAISNSNGGSTLQLTNIRSGTELFHDNVVTGSTPYGSLGLTYFRISQPGQTEQGRWGAAGAGLNWSPVAVTPGTSCGAGDCVTLNTLNAADWQASHAYAANAVMGPTSNNPNNQNFQNTAGACTSGSSRPTFPVLPSPDGNSSVNDGSCNWNNVGGSTTPSVNASTSAGFCAANPDTASANNAACAALSSGDTATRYFDANGGAYPFRDQPCFGHNQVSQPCHAWNNSGSNLPSPIWQADNPPITSGVDYFTTAPSGYTPYTYPDPLQSGSGATVSSALSGTGLSPGGVTLTPAGHTFANTAVGSGSSDSPVTFTLTNSSSSVVTAISISIAGTDASDYLEAPPATTCGTSLAVAASCQIYVSFAPVTIGVRVATLSVSDSDPSSPQTASLSGTAIPPVINPTPANPVTFGVLVTDPSIPSMVKNEDQKQDESFASDGALNRRIAARQFLLKSCSLVENRTGKGAETTAGNCAAKDSREINAADNFGHVDLLGFLHQERSGYAARASAH
jgi:hypothetical protein